MNMPAPQHYAPQPSLPAAGAELVESWRRRLTLVQTEMDREIYDFGRKDTYHLEDAANKLENALGALWSELKRLDGGE